MRHKLVPSRVPVGEFSGSSRKESRMKPKVAYLNSVTTLRKAQACNGATLHEIKAKRS